MPCQSRASSSRGFQTAAGSLCPRMISATSRRRTNTKTDFTSSVASVSTMEQSCADCGSRPRLSDQILRVIRIVSSALITRPER